MPTEENLTYQNFETITADQSINETESENSGAAVVNKPKLKKGKLILIVVLIILAVALLISGLIILSNQQPATTNNNQQPSPTPTPTPEYVTNPSPYATDSAILEIEENIKSLEKHLQETDLKETGLTPPIIDLNVSFK
jgi:cytoskeletal protein RodZ